MDNRTTVKMYLIIGKNIRITASKKGAYNSNLYFNHIFIFYVSLYMWWTMDRQKRNDFITVLSHELHKQSRLQIYHTRRERNILVYHDSRLEH